MLMRRDLGGTSGVDFFLSFWGDEWGDKKEREGGRAAPSRTNATTSRKQYRRWRDLTGK